MSIDRKSTRLNSSHLVISYAVFCLKKKIEIRLINQNLVDASLLERDRIVFPLAVGTLLQLGGEAGLGFLQFLHDALFFFFLRIWRPQGSSLFPYPALSE